VRAIKARIFLIQYFRMEYISQNEIKKYAGKLEKAEFVWGKDQRLFHLMEEVGELSEVYLQYTNKKKPPKDLNDIENGLADIFDDILALSILFDIDINNIIGKALRDQNID